jgi:omega-amidase
MRAYLARWVCLDPDGNLRRTAEVCDDAATRGSTLVLFPEAFLHGYTRTVDPARARDVFAAASRRHPEITFVFGSFTEDRRNRSTVWRAGSEIARYDKVHLFTPNGERTVWEEGDRYAAVDLDGPRLGLLTCNDLRFPEQARALVLEARCDLLVVVAWWPWRRDHIWRTLLRARAIENGVFTLGCCLAASEFPGEQFAGAGNHVFDPHGEPVRTDDDRLYTLDLDRRRGLVVDTRDEFRDVGRVEVFGAEGT